MPQRAARDSDRVAVAVLAVFDVVAAAMLAAGLGDGGGWVGSWWAVPFMAAAMAAAAFAARPRSAALLTASGVLTACCYAGRGLAILVAASYGQVAMTHRRAVLTAATWLAFGWTTAYLWLHVFKPAAGDRRRRARRL